MVGSEMSATNINKLIFLIIRPIVFPFYIKLTGLIALPDKHLKVMFIPAQVIYFFRRSPLADGPILLISIVNIYASQLFYIYGSCSYTNDIVSCDLGDIAEGGQAYVTIVIKPGKTDVGTTATVTSDIPDYYPGNNTKTVTTIVQR